MENIFRVYSEKNKENNIKSNNLFKDLKEIYEITSLVHLKILHRYDISGIDEDLLKRTLNVVFSEPPIDICYREEIVCDEKDYILAVELLPGQYDQRASWAKSAIQIISPQSNPIIAYATVYIFSGDLSVEEKEKIKKILINPVDSREAILSKPKTLLPVLPEPKAEESVKGFLGFSRDSLELFLKENSLAMSIEDLIFCQEYFKEENREPNLMEIKILDTYWSDHCRHTTFNTELIDIEIEDSIYKEKIKKLLNDFLSGQNREVNSFKGFSLMDLAVANAKKLKKEEKLNDLEESGEINACSIIREIEVDGKKEEWLIMFKNETHNHPTEIEPFGGAATCLGGAIRDPLSGRSYVYQAMRVTGAGNPLENVNNTRKGKLPQRKICKGAALGYSSYGNEIGLSTGLVSEIYHSGYVAKRMEVGAVIGAVPRAYVRREEPKPGDYILLLGGATGRDGIGGATGSSKSHTEKSVESAGAEVQKGNPPEERKLQRFFRNKEVSLLIKKCNDFGAGGVSVAIGELADGLEIDLDKIPKKYEGLSACELALSESQERMAVVISPKDEEEFINLAALENLEAVRVAKVVKEPRVKMYWKGNKLVDISRKFIDTNGVRQEAKACIAEINKEESFFAKSNYNNKLSPEDNFYNNLSSLENCCQKGLVEMFDSTVGSGTVLMPFGGKEQLSPIDAMVAKVPVLEGNTKDATVMSWGFNPYLSSWSPFHAGIYSVVEAMSKIVATGGSYINCRFSMQEYFEKLKKEPLKWGKPLSALIGMYHALDKFDTAAIGGKDSMSGSFEDLNVPPTIIAFAVNTLSSERVISSEFKSAGNSVYILNLERDNLDIPDFKSLKEKYSIFEEINNKGLIKSATTVGSGGIALSVSKMCLGNKLGFKFNCPLTYEELFKRDLGSIIFEVEDNRKFQEIEGISMFTLLGKVEDNQKISFENTSIDLDKALKKWTQTLESVYPCSVSREIEEETIEIGLNNKEKSLKKSSYNFAKPKALILSFPGTNCEYDSYKAFKRAKANPEIFVFRNLKQSYIESSIVELEKKIKETQILMFPGGFSAGDEPEGSGKFIAALFRHPSLSNAVMDLYKERDGLILGICNGFQALIKLGLLPYGEIREMREESPTLTFNNLGRHVSCAVQTKVCSLKSPWFNLCSLGDVHTIPVSHGEGRFAASKETIMDLSNNGQIATQYVDLKGNAACSLPFNPNGSIGGVEGITCPTGRILGKMGHSERTGINIGINIYGDKEQKLFLSAVNYYK